MAQHFLYFRSLPQGQGRLGENLATVHKEGNASNLLASQYILEVGRMQPQIALQPMMQEIEIVPVVDRIEFTGELLKSIEIVFAAFTLDTVEVGSAALPPERLPDLLYAPEKKFDFRNDLPLKVGFFLAIAKRVHRHLLFCFLF
jgi:hypothetical protein